MLSQKLDDMLKEAKLDAGLNVKALSTSSIQNFKGAADNIQPAVDSIAATKKYSRAIIISCWTNGVFKLFIQSTIRVCCSSS